MSRLILVAAAHPDDEVLGCGATLARHVHEDDDVHILIAAEGATARDGSTLAQTAALRQAAQNAALRIGAHPPRFLGLADNRLDSYDLLDITKKIEAIVSELSPEVVYTHHGGDLNVDHQVVHRAVLTACRPIPYSSVVAIRTFETLSSTEWAGRQLHPPFDPDHFVDVSNFLDAKLAALECYATEMRPSPHPRSYEAIKALAKLRGASVGLTAAEAFESIRTLWR